METATLLSLGEYLRTSFTNPKPDYVRGELRERPMPDFFHSSVQARLIDTFKPRQERRQLFRAPEIRVRIAPDHFRVVDFAVSPSSPRSRFPKSYLTQWWKVCRPATVSTIF